MEPLTLNQLQLYAGGDGTRCGSSGATLAIEATCAVAGAFIGWGLFALHPVGAIAGAKAGLTACTMMCHLS